MKRILVLFFSFALIAFPIYAHGEEVSSTQDSGTQIAIETPIEPNPYSTAEISTDNVENVIEENSVDLVGIESSSTLSEEQTPKPEVATLLDSENNSNITSSNETATENSEESAPIMLLQSFSALVVDKLPDHCGDINQDKVVDAIDLELAKNYIFEGGEPISGAVYDLTGDGAPDILDVVTLVNYTHRHMLPADCVLDTSNENESPSFNNFNPPTSTFTFDNYFYNVEATDPEGDALSFLLLVGPDGMVISSSTGEITWTPDVDDATSTPYLVTVEVSDGANDLSENFYLLVSLKPNAFTCGDLNGDGLINQIDLDLITEIAFENVTPHPLANPDLNGDDAWDILDVTVITNTVNRDAPAPTCGENLTPSFTNFNPATTTIATEVYSYDAEATDPNGDPLIFSLVSGPTGMTMNASSGLISWTPAESDATSTPYGVTVSVSDGSASSTRTYFLTVPPKPITPPVDNGGGGGGGGGNVSVPAGPSGGGLIGGGTPTNLSPYFVNFNPPSVITAGQAYIYDAEATDPEGQTLSFKLLTGPTDMSVINFNGLILWVPSASQVSGTAYQATIEVSDGVNSTSTDFQVIVKAPAIVEIATPIQDFGGGSEEEILPPAETEPESNPSQTKPPVTNKDVEKEGFAGALFAGILDFFGGLGDWILSHPFWSLLILLLLLLLWFILFRRRKDEEEEKKDLPVATGAVFQSSSEATPTIITIPSSPSESNESNYS